MGHQNVVDLGFDIEAISAEQKQVLSLFVDLFGKLEEYDGTKINPLKNGGLGDLRKSIQDGAKAMGEYQQIAAKYNQTITEQAQRQREEKKSVDDLTFARKAEQDNLDKAARLKAKVSQANTAAANDAALEAENLKKINAGVKANAEAYAAEIGSINRAIAAVKQLKFERNQLDATTDEGKAKIAELNVLIDQNNEFIRENASGLEKVKINIGNYPGSFKAAYVTLKDQVDSLKGSISGLDQNSPQFTQTTQQIELLEKILASVSHNFSSTRQELRAYQEAATQLGLAVGQTDEKFLLFNEAIGEVKNSINDIKAATAFQAQDAKVLLGVTDALNGIVGAYGAASAAASLFGQEEEDAQKSMAKFQQFLVLINGLQQVANVLQEESGAVQLALAAKSALKSAATKINTIVTSEAIATINAEAAANLELIESYNVLIFTEEENIAAITGIVGANTEATASALATAGAMDAEAAAAGAATAATTGLNAALIASGIGVVIVAIGAAVAYLIVKIREWTASTELNAKQQKELNDALASQIDALQKINDLQDAAGKRSLENIQHQLDLEGRSGQNQYAILAIKQKIADKNAEIADAKYAQVLAAAEDKYVKDGLIGVDALHRAQNDYFEDLTDKTYKASVVQRQYDEVLKLSDQQRKQQGYSDKEIERLKDRLAAAQSEQNLAQKNYDFFVKGEKDKTDAQHEQQGVRTEIAKLSSDEQRKLTLETTKLDIDAQKDRNSKILSDARSTLAQRLAAIRSNRDQEKQEADAELAAARDQFKLGQITPAELETAERQANAARSKADRDYLAQKHQEERAAYERDRDAALAAYRVQIDQQIKIAQDLQQGKVNNANPLEPAPKASLSNRLKGLSDEYAARKDLLNAELKVELDKEGQTAEEKKAIYEKYGADISDLGRDFKATYLDLEKQAQEQSIAEWRKYYQERENEVDFNEIDQLKALEDARDKDLVGIREYNRQRQKIEDEARLTRAQGAVQDAYIAVNATKQGTAERAAAEAHLAETIKTLNGQVAANHQHTEDQKRDKVLNTLGDIQAGYQNLQQGVGAILDISYENQKAQLANLEADQQKNYETQVARIQATTGTDEERAARLKVLEDQRAAQKEANDRKERQMEVQRAQFEKAASITSVILDTTKAIVGFLHNPGGFAGVALSVAAGITGAAQLAKAVATQVPHYKLGAGVKGRPLHTGGLFVAGDGGEPELISEPGKKPYLSPATATLLEAGPMTSVVPISMLDDMSRMWVTDQGILSYQAPDNSGDLREIRNAIGWLGGVVKESAKANRPRVTVVNNIGKDLAHAAWVRKNVFD